MYEPQNKHNMHNSCSVIYNDAFLFTFCEIKKH